MTTPGLPPEIGLIRESMSLTRYVLPKRNLGAACKVGWAPIGFGSVVTVFMVFWMSGPIAGGLASPGLGKWIGIGFGLLGLPGLVVGIGLILVGVAILTNISHSEVVVGEGVICAIERIGIVPIRRKRRLHEVQRFVVHKGGLTVKNHNTGARTTYAPEFAALEVETATGKPMKLVLGYPYELLRPLADVLASTLSLGGQSSLLESQSAIIDVIEPDADGPAQGDLAVPKPAGTDITFQEDARGLAISVPAKGLWKGSQGLFGFSLFWNLFLSVVTVAMINSHPPAEAGLIISAFWGVGLLLLGLSINMGKKKVLIAVTQEVLACRVMGPFRHTEWKIPLAMIDTVQVGPSGVEVNNRPVMELQIIPKNGKKRGLLSNRAAEEKAWLAYLLRQAFAERLRPAS